MDIALDCRQQYFARRARCCLAAFFLFLLHEWREIGNGLLHDACGLYHLRQKHFASAKQVTDHIHTVHQRAFDHMEGTTKFCPRLLSIINDKVGDPLNEGMLQSRLNRGFAPGQIDNRLASTIALISLSNIEKPLGCVAAAIEDDIFNRLAKVVGNFIIDCQLAGIDNPHIHTRSKSMVQKNRVHGLTDGFVPAERKRDVRHAARNARTGQARLDQFCRFNEINCIIIMLFDTRRNRENIRIENNVRCRKTYFLRQETI